MGGIARLAIEKGISVTGADENCYPPMSDQLEAMGIDLLTGYDPETLKSKPDSVVVGNALSRGNPLIEEMLNTNQDFVSGPQWLKENILHDKWVIAVAGTHGKTTTASMIVWILEQNGFNPGFLVGGVLENFGVSARYTDSPFFVVEADEYDTAFFDKRSKFVHYRARTCVLNNLEFDHADIFKDLAAIETQFHHLVRTVPQNGLLIRPQICSALDRVIEKGCWTPIETVSIGSDDQSNWNINKLNPDASHCEVLMNDEIVGELDWNMMGDHNANNALAAIAAARHVGVLPNDATSALSKFQNVKRRMELKGIVNQITVYDDFAHHPTAIRTTMKGLKERLSLLDTPSRIIAVIDPRSNTMKMGCHNETLADSVSDADYTIFHIPDSFSWSLFDNHSDKIVSLNSVEKILDSLVNMVIPGDHILIMSNGGFEKIHERLIALLENSNAQNK
jgi:UDP-N-acetylmuramate: L-alanyl-gamma-D-glutamyl-meso-diaminopimelate ligase